MSLKIAYENIIDVQISFIVNLFYLFIFIIIVYKSFDWCKIKIIPFKNNVLLIIVYYISKFLELIGSVVLLKEKKNSSHAQ